MGKPILIEEIESASPAGAGKIKEFDPIHQDLETAWSAFKVKLQLKIVYELNINAIDTKIETKLYRIYCGG